MPTLHVKVNLDLPTEVPEKMVRLLSIDKKSELQKYCDSISVSTYEFAALTMNAGSIGYFHDMKQYEKRYIDPPDFSKLWPMGQYDANNPQHRKLLRKMGSVFDQRRIMVVHVFVASGRWHVLYSDQRDRDPVDNHWKHGPHFHFANYLWPEYSLEKVLNIFSTPDGALGGTIHLRYVDSCKPPMAAGEHQIISGPS